MKITDILIENEIEEFDDGSREVPVENWGYLNEKIDKLNKKAAKLGVAPLRLEKIGEITKKYKDGAKTIERQYYKVKVHGERIKVHGWTLICSIDFEEAGVILRVVPGETVPEEYRYAQPTCEHCKTKRFRKNVYVLRNDQTGETISVGGNCLADYFGQDPARILAASTWLRTLDNIFDDSEEYFGSGGSRQIEIERYLINVAVMIRVNGWLSRSQARINLDADNGLSTFATADAAMNNMFPTPRNPAVPATPEDVELAEKSLTWVRTELVNKNNKSDFEHNLCVLAGGSFCTYKHVGIVAAIIPAYLRQQQWYAEQQERKRQAALARGNVTSEYVGTIGEKFKWVKDKAGNWKTSGLELKLLFKRSIESFYGPSEMHKFVDRNGNYFTWFSSSSADFTLQHWYRVNATIKDHKEYKGEKSTILTRVASVEDLGEN